MSERLKVRVLPGGPMEYKRENGSYYLYDDNTLTDRGTLKRCHGVHELAMAYDPVCFTLFKHGERSAVEGYVAEAKVKGYPHPIDIITFSSDYPVDRINKVLSTSGYLRYILEDTGKVTELG